jgi:beta-glucanase (GH16 family)
LWPAFWLRHRDGASVAEIDIMEIFHSQIPGLTRSVVHLVDGDGNFRFNIGGGWRANLEDPRQSSGWHTYGVDILPEGDNVRFRFYLDGQEYGNYLDTDAGNWSTRYPGQPLFDVSLNLAVGGEWTGHPDDAQLGRLDLIGRCAIGGTTTGYPNNCKTASSQGIPIQRWQPGTTPTFDIDYIRIYELD